MLSTNSVFLAVLAAGIASVNAAPRPAEQPIARDAPANRTYAMPCICGVGIDSCMLLKPSSSRCSSGTGTALPRNAQTSSGLQVSNITFHFHAHILACLHMAACCGILLSDLSLCGGGTNLRRSFDHTASLRPFVSFPFPNPCKTTGRPGSKEEWNDQFLPERRSFRYSLILQLP